MAFMKSKFLTLWKTAQVELQGEYSTQRVRHLFTYSKEAGTLRVLLAQFGTPLPCLAITAIVDMMPMRPIAEGIDSQQLFFVRAFLSFWLANTTTYNQFKHIVPQLPLSNVKIAIYGAVVAAITVAVMYGLILVIGFPLPFSIVTMSPLWLSLFMLPMVSWMIKSRTDSVAWPLVATSLKVMICQEILVVVYPTFFYVFTAVPDRGKTYFALLLPVLKLVFRNAMARTVGYLSDEVPEGVILNVEVVSALFVSYCMQNTPSVQMTIVLMVVDALQMSASLYDIGIIIKRMKALRKRTTVLTETERLNRRANSEFNLAQGTFSRQTNSHKASPVPTSPLTKSILKLSAVVQPFIPNPHESSGKRQKFSISSTTPVLAGVEGFGPTYSGDVATAVGHSFDLQYVLELKRVLYITEFVVLLNYVEVIIPLIFSAYLFMMYHLPNRVYYKQINGMDDTQLWNTLSNVLLYSGLQLASLIVLNMVLWQKMGISGFRQLSFVLERQCSPVQNKLILWVFYNVQTALQHFGFNFAVTFAWLQRNQSE